MAAKLIEITGTYQSERFRFANPDGDVVICEVFCNSDINATRSFKGQADLDELQRDQTYRFYGRWTTYKNKRTGDEEEQFAFQSFVREQPHNREGIVSYLRQAGEGLGFGNVRALKCWELFGSDAVRKLREEPHAVADSLTAAGLPFTREKADIVAEKLAEDSALEGCTLDLMDLLTGRGFPKVTPKAAVKLWGNRAANIIRRCPYKLMTFRGCGFKKTDALYLDLKHDPNAVRRQGYCLWYGIARDTEGHTWYPQAFVERELRGSISGSQIKFEQAVTFSRRLGAVAEARTISASGPVSPEGRLRWFAEAKKARNELDIAQVVADASREPCWWPSLDSLTAISDHQREQLSRSLAGPIGILGGSPGTGKTYALADLAKALCGILGSDSILIGAPTGKAAVRVTENLARYGLPLRARTWHSTLALLERWKTKHYPYKVLIGDESSMVDTDLMAAVLRARSAGTHFLLVGDVNQLPPVGHGAPLRDLIAAGLPYGELREIKRNSGGIVEACAAIRDGQRWMPGDNLLLDECQSPEGQIAMMLDRIREAKHAGLDPVWDVQPLVPTNGKVKNGQPSGSPLSRKVLNKLLQQELNQNPGVEGSPFRVGDKVVNTKNGYFPAVTFDTDDPDIQASEKGEVYVANGELAEVLEVQPGYLVAKLANPARTIRIPRGKPDERDTEPTDGQGSDEDTGTGCSWDLGYCLSVHKSQGSEWPHVIVLLDSYPGAKMVCSREWLYTGISRAKDRCVLVGTRDVADSMVRRVALNKRKTLLKEQVLLRQAMNEIAEL